MSFNFVHYSNNTLLLVSLFWLNQNESFCECLSTRCFINCKSFTTIFRIYLLLKWNEFLFSLSVSQKSFSLGGFRLKVSNFSVFPTISYSLYDIDFMIIYMCQPLTIFSWIRNRSPTYCLQHFNSVTYMKCQINSFII